MAAAAARPGGLRPGTVTDVAGSSIRVVLDGEPEPIYVERLTPGPVLVGYRVLVQFEPPHGAFITAAGAV